MKKLVDHYPTVSQGVTRAQFTRGRFQIRMVQVTSPFRMGSCRRLVNNMNLIWLPIIVFDGYAFYKSLRQEHSGIWMMRQLEVRLGSPTYFHPRAARR